MSKSWSAYTKFVAGPACVVGICLVILFAGVGGPDFRSLQSVAAVSGSTGKLFSGEPFRTRPALTSLVGESVGKTTLKWLTEQVPCKGTQWAALTTINEPSEAVKNLLSAGGWCLVVVGDLKGPLEYKLPLFSSDSLVFLDATFQKKLAEESAFIANIPWSHFGRKNIAYFVAIARGAQVIWDFDDDNIVTASTFASSVAKLQDGSLDVIWAPHGTGQLKDAQVLNIYPPMGCPVKPCWPRGFPLTLLRDEPPPRSEWTHTEDNKKVAVLQSIANNDPDMDAIFRLASNKPTGVYFSPPGQENLGLPPSVFCPWNGQATLWRRDAFWGMFLPMTVTGRVSDIWRSYLVQRLMWDTGLRIAFAPPIVRQDRNVHNFLADLNAEQQLYMQTEKLIEFLGSWHSTKATLQDRIEDLWGDAYERGYLEEADLQSLKIWINALESVGYDFPDVVDSPDSALGKRMKHQGKHKHGGVR
jgi:hypothetical protein